MNDGVRRGDVIAVIIVAFLTGYVGLMTFIEHDDILTHYITYYCPECGAEIDVRGD